MISGGRRCFVMRKTHTNKINNKLAGSLTLPTLDERLFRVPTSGREVLQSSVIAANFEHILSTSSLKIFTEDSSAPGA